jgi:hypothetical protein
MPIDITQFFCPNEACVNFGEFNVGNIGIRGTYGKNKDKVLLYCRTCGKRFGTTQGSPLFGAHLSSEMITMKQKIAEKKSIQKSGQTNP